MRLLPVGTWPWMWVAQGCAFGSYLHHSPNNQRHLPGYEPKWGKDLGGETKEKVGTVAFQAHAVEHNSLLPFSGRREHDA